MADKEKGKIKTNENSVNQLKCSIGGKIKHERVRRKQSAERVAERVGITRVALTHIENGRNNVSAVQLWRLACALGCDVNDFFPVVPEGFALTKSDFEKIAAEDKQAVSWAEELIYRGSE